MKFDHRSLWPRSVLFNGWRVVAALVMVLCFGAAASAEDFLLETPDDGLLAFQSDQDRQDYIKWVKDGGRSAWLFFSDRMMKPCGRGEDEACQQNMVIVRNQYPVVLEKARLVVNGVKDRFLLALRNGNFIYPIAPSYQLLQAIVGRPGNCVSWAAIANQRLNMPSGGLRRLSDDADAELPRGSSYPERAVLDGRRGQPGLLETARSCNTL